MSRGIRIRAFDYVNRPYEEVQDLLGEDALDLFRSATREAAARAQKVATRLAVNVGSLEVGTEIALAVRRVEDRAREVTAPPSTVLELEWEAASAPRLFPIMRAELSVYPLTATETQVDFQGEYEPPLGGVGRAVDALVGRRIAEASVHRFVREIAAYLRKAEPGD